MTNYCMRVFLCKSKHTKSHLEDDDALQCSDNINYELCCSKLHSMNRGQKHESAAPLMDKLVFSKVIVVSHILIHYRLGSNKQ